MIQDADSQWGSWDISRFRDGDKETFRSICNRWSLPLQLYVLKRFDNLGVAQQIAEESLYNIFKDRTSLKSYEDIVKYLYLTTRKQLIAFFRENLPDSDLLQNLPPTKKDEVQLHEVEIFELFRYQYVIDQVNNSPTKITDPE